MRKEKLKTRVIRSKESIPVYWDWDMDYVDHQDHRSNMVFYLKISSEGYFIEAIEHIFNKAWFLHSIEEERLKILEQRYETEKLVRLRS